MPESGTPSHEIARASIPVSLDLSEANAALDALEARLDAIVRKAAEIRAGWDESATGKQDLQVEPAQRRLDPVPEQENEREKDKFAERPSDPEIVETMEKVQDRADRQRLVTAAERLEQLVADILEQMRESKD
jgi:hypothetical protein